MSRSSRLGKAAVQALPDDSALAQKLPDKGGPLQIRPVPEGGGLQRPILRHAHELHMGACWSEEVPGGSLYHICGSGCAQPLPIDCHMHELQMKPPYPCGSVWWKGCRQSALYVTASPATAAICTHRGRKMAHHVLQGAWLSEAHLIERVSLQDVGHIEPGRQLLCQRGLTCIKSINVI